MNYIKLIFDIKKPETIDIISALLLPMNPEGSEEMENKLLVFFKESDFDEAGIQEILNPFSIDYSKETIIPENWNAQWESNFEPVRINHQLGVRATFHPPFPDCQYDIVITPKMSFGTGHHETTQMMLEFASQLDFHNKTVLDFGCGTGILAIFASMKGAAYVMGIDNDEGAVANAKENCLINQCPQIEITNHHILTLDRQFDVILANINLTILLESLPQLQQLLQKNGKIILSGILYSDIPKLTECFTGLGLRLVAQVQKKDWAALYIN